jgi:hypothetical protein
MDPRSERVFQRFVGFVLCAIASAGIVHCSGSPDGSTVVGDPPATTGGAAATPGGGNPAAAAGTLNINVGGGIAQDGPCQGLECQQTTCLSGSCTVPACPPGQSTTVSGTVFDPAGKLPLYNVVVYVPNGPVPPITTGASCDRCETAIANPVVAALTDTHGKFTLKDVPVGTAIPLVIQVGKWRRQVTIPTVTACVDTPMADPNLTRLPRNRMEGDIPRIAITTGGADSMECLPRRMGIDDSEFSTLGGEGRVHLFAGGDTGGINNEAVSTKAFAATLNAGAALAPATDLWATKEALTPYDIVLLSCEGDVNEPQKPVAARQAMYDYASVGGRVFASHWHRIWFSDGPDPVPSIGSWADREDPQDPATGVINTSFPKGADFADWLVNVQASTVSGELGINVARDNVHHVDATQATEWITLPSNEKCVSGCRRGDDACEQNCMEFPSAVQYLSFNTPLMVPEADKCGRVVFTDLHVSATGAEADKNGAPFPEGCEMRDLSSQEKAVAFMLFDLSSCIQDDEDPPQVPK